MRLLTATKGLPAAIAKGLLHLLAFFLLDTYPKGIDHLWFSKFQSGPKHSAGA
jgi:hypothetical protein